MVAKVAIVVLYGLALGAAVSALWKMMVAGGSGASEGASLGAGAIVVAILSAPFLIWRTVIAQGNLEAAREGQITDRIAKAVEQLGAERTVKRGKREETEPNVAVRIGGILALERIAQDSVRFHEGRDHVRIMELLCAYIRTNAPAEGAKDHGLDPFTLPASGAGYALEVIETRRRRLRAWARSLPPPRADIVAALNVIGRRGKAQLALEAAWPEQPDATTRWPFDIDPPAPPGADATEAERARHLDDVRAWKAAMTLYKGYRVDLRGTNLQGSDLAGKQLGGALLADARLDGAKAGSVQLQGARLFGTEMVRCSLRRASLRFAWLDNTNLEASVILKTDARYLKCSDRKVKAVSAATFRDVILQGASFARASLDGWIFRKCTFDDQTDLTNATLFEADLATSTLPPEILAKAHGDDSTTLPDGVDRPAAWPSPRPTAP
ncbi:MAG: pentapeptide repeat-containing protein [Gemmobacter sp.]